MAKHVLSLTCSAVFLAIILLCSCGNMVKKSKELEREKVLKEIEDYKSRLPYTIPGTGITLTRIDVDKDIIVYSCRITKDNWDAMSLASEMATSDRNIARVISNISNNAVDKFIEYELGLKYIYISDETSEKLLEIEIPSQKLKEIKEKVDKGEVQAYTMIEISQMELAKLDIPSQIDEGIWLTDAYIKGSNVYYECTIENELDASDLSSEAIAELRASCIEGIKEEGMVMMHKKSIIKENIHFIYIYKDNRGKEFARITISPDDL